MSDLRPAARSRLLYAPLLLLSIALGLASRRYAAALPSFISAYAGDALWAAMVFWIAALLFPLARTRILASAALGISVAVELSQIYHAPWIDDLRAARLGALALGHGFLWSDLLCYAAGVAAAAAVDLVLCRSQRRRVRMRNIKQATGVR
ncbi:ribosomal maturation YjgA family protein [Lacipirellula limnantheis]|uniref:DUF2809 domain-containing protein n=1 Tax=Lacipirellula limnantheis TaxID=2528024 RepID=A0A517U5C3_9BACT|nr:DUF2809 domain-containing protein [Lacipirellula limnantheis]QDT75835.1 hypothetical protein I41_50780 [Lacipirellula limnantheis]